MLSLRAEQDGHLRQRLQHVLKLSKEKWDEAKDHALRAVVADNRMRAWYANQQQMDMGLLFVTQMGKIDLDRPVGESRLCKCAASSLPHNNYLAQMSCKRLLCV